MNVLAFNSKVNSISISIKNDKKVYYIKKFLDTSASQVSCLNWFVALHGFNLKDFDLILTSSGPAGFTGVRNSLAILKAFSLLGYNVRTLNNFDVMKKIFYQKYLNGDYYQAHNQCDDPTYSVVNNTIHDVTLDESDLNEYLFCIYGNEQKSYYCKNVEYGVCDNAYVSVIEDMIQCDDVKNNGNNNNNEHKHHKTIEYKCNYLNECTNVNNFNQIKTVVYDVNTYFQKQLYQNDILNHDHCIAFRCHQLGSYFKAPFQNIENLFILNEDIHDAYFLTKYVYENYSHSCDQIDLNIVEYKTKP